MLEKIIIGSEIYAIAEELISLEFLQDVVV